MELDLVHDLLCEEFGVIPTNKDKSPALPKNHPFLYERIPMDDIGKYFTNAYGIAISCGGVSGGLECMDFDDHDGKFNIEKKLREFCSSPFPRSLIDSNKVYVQKTPSGGFHVVYRYESKKHEGSRKLARWPDRTVMIETRGHGGYFVTYPTEGYKQMFNNYFDLRSIDNDERNLLIDIAKTFNMFVGQEDEKGGEKNHMPIDPVSYYNYNCHAHARNVLRDSGWKCADPKPTDGIQKWTRPGKDSGISATFGFRDNLFYVFSSNGFPFSDGVFYSPFEILVLIQFKKDWRAAMNWVVEKYISKDVPYIRVGTSYFKKIHKRDRFGIKRMELKVWTKDEIKTDHGAGYLERIPKFDDFTIEPDNRDFRPIIDNCYNLYSAFSHKPSEGEWKWTKILLEHVFGDQYGIGIKYVQSLYQNPKRALPILALVSRERSTGKTTFLNWLGMIFGANMVIVNPDDITGSFNSLFTKSNIICIEETLIEKRVATEKIKALSTGKFVSVNEKYVSNYKIPFYGHIIMTSNEVKRFINIDEQEIRFFIRRLNKPKFQNFNIEEDVISEIPAFLHHLDTLPELDYSRSRALFTPEEIANENLQSVKNESKSWLYEEILTEVQDFFNNNANINAFYASVKDIKNKFFSANNKVDMRFIRKVLADEFSIEQQKMMRYAPFEDVGFSGPKKPGTPFLFKRDESVEVAINIGDDCPF